MASDRDVQRLERLLADRERSIESVVDLGIAIEERLAATRASRTWRIQEALAAALGSPREALRLPANLLRALSTPAPATPSIPPDVLELSSNSIAGWEAHCAGRPRVLVIVPWLAVGGAERVALDVMRSLSDELAFAIVTTVPDGNLWAPAFAELTPWIFHAPRYQPARPAELVAELAAKLNVDAALISSTREGYKALAALRRNGLKWAADIVHSAAPEGHLDTAANCDRLLDKHFAVGSVQAKALESAGVAVDKIVLAPNGVDVQGEFNPDCYRGKISAIRSELRLPESARVLTFVGRLSEEKDPLAFVQIAATAMASNERIFAVMAGDGPLRFAVEQAVRHLDVGDRFRIVGLTSRSAELLAASDVFVLPSRVEGSPLTLLEAMSLERIVVAADVGAVREILRNGENGILISPPSVEGFNQALARLQRGEPVHEQYGRAARQTVVDGFDLRNTLGIYRSILLSAAQQARHERGMIS